VGQLGGVRRATSGRRRDPCGRLLLALGASALAVAALAPGCGGSPARSAASVVAPRPPRPYRLPAHAVRVSSARELVAALRQGRKTIVLDDGTYGLRRGYFVDWAGSSLYARHLGRAVLTAGLVVGGKRGRGGAIVRGLAFRITDPAATFQSSALNVWGPAGHDTHVLDASFDGGWAVGVGLLALDPAGLVAHRLTFRHFTDEGIRASDNVPAPYGARVPVIHSISDIVVDGVSRAVPGSSNGTAEAGLWIGEPVATGVHRIRIRDCAISGIETVNNSWDTTFTSLDIDMAGPHAKDGVAVYLEHDTIGDTFERFRLTGARTGFNAEWNGGVAGSTPTARNRIQNGTISAAGWSRGGATTGVYLDEGTGSTTISGVTFTGQSWAAIATHGVSDPATIRDNTYRLAPRAQATTAAAVPG
jgi:hypothetical protein